MEGVMELINKEVMESINEGVLESINEQNEWDVTLVTTSPTTTAVLNSKGGDFKRIKIS